MSLAPSLRDALEIHLRRPIHCDGVRRVTIDVCSDGEVQLRLHIGHAWRAGRGDCDSVFCVLPGSPFAGTAVLMSERAWVAEPRIWVRPVTARRSIAVARHRCEEHVIGTDFGYDDIRMFTPRLVINATEVEADDGGFLLRSEWDYRDRDPIRGYGRIDRNGVLVAADLTPKGAPSPLRRLRAEKVMTVQGMVTPRVIRVARPADGFSSVMRLAALRPEGIAHGLFTPERLDEAAAAVAASSMAATRVEEPK